MVLAAYKPPDVSKANCFDNITKALDFHGNKHENVISMGDFNTILMMFFLVFRGTFSIKSRKFPTFYKSTYNPSSNDLIITIKSHSF